MKLASRVMFGLGGLTIVTVGLSAFIGGLKIGGIAKRYAIPTSPEEVKALVRIPEGENAYGRYLVFQHARRVESEEAGSLLDPSYRATASTKAFDAEKVEFYLGHYPKTVAAATELANGAKWFADRDMSGGPVRTLFPELAELKFAVKFLTWKAELQISKGDRNGALDSYARAAKIGSFLNSEPTVIGSLIYIACESIVLSSMARCSVAIAKDPIALENAEKILKSMPNPDLALAMKGESYYCYYSTTKGIEPEMIYGSASHSSRGPRWDPTVAFLNATSDIWGPSILTAEGRMVESAQGNDYHRFEAQGAITDKWRATSGLDQYVAGILVPTFNQIGFSSERLIANRELVSLGLKGIADGRKPDVAGTRDPFTNKPYKLVATPHGWSVYSVGQDGIDEGGVVDDQHPSQTKDIVFRYDGDAILAGR